MRRDNRTGQRKTTGTGGRSCVRRKWDKAWILVLFLGMALCGCTRREQLVLETGAVTDEAAPAAEPGSAEGLPAADTGDGREPSEAQAALASGDGGVAAAADQAVQEQEPPAAQTICVHVCGAVRKPDVYDLPAGSRVYEAVEQAGGFTEEADESYVNQAQILSDGVKLVIPTTEQTQAALQEGQAGVIGATEGVAAAAGQERDSGAAGVRININTATEAQLCEIPGIGATRAAAIISYRQEYGGFAKIEDIMNVSGIKEGTYVKIKDSITVN